LKWTILVEFLVNLYVFPFAVELVLVPVIFFFVMLQMVDEHNTTDLLITQFINGVLLVVGFGLIAYAAVSAIGDFDGFLTRNAEDFLVASALTLAFVPFLYGVAGVSRPEQANLRRRFRPISNSLPEYEAR
jgi:hypothetical protein